MINKISQTILILALVALAGGLLSAQEIPAGEYAQMVGRYELEFYGVQFDAYTPDSQSFQLVVPTLTVEQQVGPYFNGYGLTVTGDQIVLCQIVGHVTDRRVWFMGQYFEMNMSGGFRVGTLLSTSFLDPFGGEGFYGEFHMLMQELDGPGKQTDPLVSLVSVRGLVRARQVD